MLDQFLWGRVKRISPEAPVPVVEFETESFMPGGAANVARNLTALNAGAEVFGIVGKDDSAKKNTGATEAGRCGIWRLDGRNGPDDDAQVTCDCASATGSED